MSLLKLCSALFYSKARFNCSQVLNLMLSHQDEHHLHHIAVKMKAFAGKRWKIFGVSQSTFPLIKDSYFYCNEVK